MKIRGFILFLLCLSAPLAASAQTLPELQADERIECGTLPCGLDYRIVASSVDKGYASAALVQRDCAGAGMSREALLELEHCAPLQFLLSRGIAPSEAGYIQYKSDARIFRFDDIPFDSQDARDSALLVLSDLARLSRKPQTLILAGDFDKAALKRTLSILSLTIPSIEVSRTPGPGLAHTPVPLVRDLMERELDFIVRERMRAAREHSDSARLSVLSSLRADGADSLELVRAKAMCLPQMLEAQTIRSDFSRREYIDRCIDDVTAGAVTTSYASAQTFFYRRKLKPERELELFNDYVRTAVRTQDAVAAAPVREAFVPLDSILANQPQARPVKVVSTAKEPVSGGSLWVLSNGMKVIYCKMPTPYSFRYCLLFKGGLAARTDLAQGQGAWFDDLFDMYGAGGVSAGQLRAALQAEGISRRAEVGLSGMTLSGEARSSRLSQTLGSLALLSAERVFDDSLYAALRRSAADVCLSARPADIRERLDSALCPTYSFSPIRSGAALTDDLPQKADDFFDEELSSWRDALLIICGDVQEDKLRKAVCQAFGRVPSYLKGRKRRVAVPYTMLSGRNRVYGKGGEQRLDFALTAEVPLSLQSYLTARLAGMAVRDALSDSLIRAGISMESSIKEFSTPREMIRMYLTFKPVASVDALPAGIVPAEGFQLFSPVIRSLRQMASMPVGKDALARYKTCLKAELAAELADPEHLCRYVVYRYSDNKDIIVNYQKYLDQIGPDQVSAMLKAFAEGPRSSYRITDNGQ